MAIDAGNFRPAKLQATVFLLDAAITGRHLLEVLPDTWKKRFDGDDLVVLPLPDDAPPELPRATIPSASREWVCEVTGNRIDVIWQARSTAQDAPSLAAFFTQSAGLQLDLIAALEFKATRLAGIVTRIAEVAGAARYLAEHFCAERWLTAPFNRPEAFELNAHKRFKLQNGFEVNSWVKNRTGRMAPSKSEIVLVEQDVNTVVAEEGLMVLDAQAVRGFFGALSAEMDTILCHYYPARPA